LGLQALNSPTAAPASARAKRTRGALHAGRVVRPKHAQPHSSHRGRGTSHTSLPFLVSALSYYHSLASAPFLSQLFEASIILFLLDLLLLHIPLSTPARSETQRLRLDSIETSSVEQLRHFGFAITRTSDIHSHIAAALAPDRIPGRTCYTHHPLSLLLLSLACRSPNTYASPFRTALETPLLDIHLIV
jgi:hypothetical protein